jgi:hypothetical protein
MFFSLHARKPSTRDIESTDQENTGCFGKHVPGLVVLVVIFTNYQVDYKV